MKTLNFKDFMKKYNLKNNTLNESELQRVFTFSIYPRSSKLLTDRRFVNIDDGRIGGTHWNCFTVKYNHAFYFDSFGDQPDRFLLKQLPKPIIYHS